MVEFASVMSGDFMLICSAKLSIVQVYVVICPLLEALVDCSSNGLGSMMVQKHNILVGIVGKQTRRDLSRQTLVQVL